MAGMLANFLMANSKGLYPPTRGTAARKRRKKSVRAAVKRSGKRRAKTGKPARLVKGSRAAKAYMAKIRRKRRR
jgi:hypothetical protein